jgi:peptide/nickel transport system substrate-binding protein
VADPDQFVMSHRSNYLWTKGRPYPAMDALIEKWMKEPNIEKRKTVLFEMQELYNNQPTSVGVYYPNESFAYRSDKYDQWIETPGYGIINKYSFLPEDARKGMTKSK